MFTKAQLASFRRDFDAANKDLAAKYNIEIALGTIRYSLMEFHTTLTARAIDRSGKPAVDVLAFSRNKQFLGLDVNIGEQVISESGTVYTVIDIDAGKRTKCVVLSAYDKTYYATVEQVNRLASIPAKA